MADFEKDISVEPDAASAYSLERSPKIGSLEDELRSMGLVEPTGPQEVPPAESIENTKFKALSNSVSADKPQSWVGQEIVIGELGGAPEGYEAPSLLEAAAPIIEDIGLGIVEAPQAILRGVAGGASEILSTFDEFAWWLEEVMPLGTTDTGNFLIDSDDNALQWMSENIASVRDTMSERQSDSGKAIELIVQWLSSAGVVGKVSKAAGVPKGVFKNILDAFVGSAAGFDPRQERLSNMIDEVAPNPITDYLKADEEDPVLLARMKSGLENAGLQAAADGILIGMKALRKAYKANPDDVTTVASTPEGDALDIQPSPVQPEEAVMPVEVFKADGDEIAQMAQKYIDGMDVPSPVKVNISTFEGPDQIKEEIAKLADFLPETVTVSNETTVRQAKALGLNPEDFITGIEGNLYDRKQIAAGWMMFRSSAEELVGLAEKARRTGSPEDISRFVAGFQVNHSIMQTVKGQSSEIARALQIHRRLRQRDEGMMKALQRIVDESGGSETAMELAERVTSLRDTESIARLIDETAKATTAEKALFAYSNILMSNPATQVVNILDTASATLWRAPEAWFASKVGDNVAQGEAASILYGQLYGVRDGLRHAFRTLKSGQESFAPQSKIEIPGTPAVSARDLGAVNSNARIADYAKMMLPTNLSRAGDQLMKVMNYHASKHALIHRQVSITEGLSGAEARRRAAQLYDNTPSWIEEESVADAIAGTFNEPLQGKLAPALSNSMNAMTIQGVPFGRILFATFIRTPINLLRWTTHRTPAAFMSPKIREELAAGGVRRDVALGRIAMGSAVLATFADFTMQGKITGAGPKDPRVRKMLQEQEGGWQAYSIKVGDTWYSYNRFATLGSLIGIAADAVELLTGVYNQQSDVVEIDGIPVEENVMASVTLPFANAILSKTYMQQITRFVDALSDPNRYGDTYFQALFKSAVPAVVGAVERTVDPEIRRAETNLEAVRSKIPGLSDDLPPKLDQWGRTIEDQNGLLNIFAPTRRFKARGAAIDKEMARLDLPPSFIKDVIQYTHKGMTSRIKLSPEIHNDYIKMAGNDYKVSIPGIRGKVGALEALNKIVSGKAGTLSKQYSKLADEEKGKMIKTIISKYRQDAKKVLINKYPELKQQIRGQIESKRQAIREGRKTQAPIQVQRPDASTGPELPSRFELNPRLPSLGR